MRLDKTRQPVAAASAAALKSAAKAGEARASAKNVVKLLPGVQIDLSKVRTIQRPQDYFEAEGGVGFDLPDPKPLDEDAQKVKKERYGGPTFVDGAKPEDVRQGAIPNCYVPSGCAAVAAARPGLLEQSIQEVKKVVDGVEHTFWEVSFFKRGFWGGVKRDSVEVDADLWTKAPGKLAYGRSTGSVEPSQMELWWPILEKAYADANHHSYEKIGNGGYAGDVFFFLLGVGSYDVDTSRGPDEVWSFVKNSVNQRLPVCAGTYDDKSRYTNSGIYADHSYSVLGYQEENGKRYVLLRNPWGKSEPSGNGADDGVFRLEVEDFCEYYQQVTTTEPF